MTTPVSKAGLALVEAAIDDVAESLVTPEVVPPNGGPATLESLTSEVRVIGVRVGALERRLGRWAIVIAIISALAPNADTARQIVLYLLG